MTIISDSLGVIALRLRGYLSILSIHVDTNIFNIIVNYYIVERREKFPRTFIEMLTMESESCKSNCARLESQLGGGNTPRPAMNIRKSYSSLPSTLLH